MSQTASARTGARRFVFVGAFVAVLGVAASCSLARRANGDSCLKDEDCLSGICAGEQCVAAAPLLDAARDAEAGATTTDAADAAAADTATAKDTSTPKEAAAEAAPEASSSDTGSSSEAGPDGSGDGAGD